MSRNRFNQYNFMEIEREKEKFKQRKNKLKSDKNKNIKENKLRKNAPKDYDYFKKYGTYRSDDNCRSLKEEALYKYFAYID